MTFFRKPAEPFLPDRDYLPMAIPTTDLEVLGVLARDKGALRRFTQLETVLRAPEGTAAIRVHRDEPAAAVKGTAGSTMKAGIGLSVLASLIQLLGGKPVGAQLDVGKTASVDFCYVDVTADRVDLGAMDEWLAVADLNASSHAIADLLVSEELYAVVGRLKAHGLSVTFLDEANASVKVDVPMVAEAVGANVSVSAGGTSSSTLTFTGTTPLVVAAKAAQIRCDPGRGFSLNERLAGDGEIRGLGSADTTRYLATEHGSLALG